jgi:hypothetical protein
MRPCSKYCHSAESGGKIASQGGASHGHYMANVGVGCLGPHHSIGEFELSL